jgi:hypothetical protein
MEKMTLNSINDRLRHAPKVIREISDTLQNGSDKALKILATRDSLDAAISKTGAEIRTAIETGNAQALSEISARLSQQVENRSKLTIELSTAMGAAGAQAAATLAPLANSILAMLPALTALQQCIMDLPQSVVQKLATGLEAIKL